MGGDWAEYEWKCCERQSLSQAVNPCRPVKNSPKLWILFSTLNQIDRSIIICRFSFQRINLSITVWVCRWMKITCRRSTHWCCIWTNLTVSEICNFFLSIFLFPWHMDARFVSHTFEFSQPGKVHLTFNHRWLFIHNEWTELSDGTQHVFYVNSSIHSRSLGLDTLLHKDFPDGAASPRNTPTHNKIKLSSAHFYGLQPSTKAYDLVTNMLSTILPWKPSRFSWEPGVASPHVAGRHGTRVSWSVD